MCKRLLCLLILSGFLLGSCTLVTQEIKATNTAEPDIQFTPTNPLIPTSTLFSTPTPTANSETTQQTSTSTSEPGFSFAITADMRYFTGSGEYDTDRFFRGAVKSLKSLRNTSFMISPGDIDPPQKSYWTIQEILGVNYRWYPVVGNHDTPGSGEETTFGSNLQWLENFPYGKVNPGPTGCPTTTYSFDYEGSHFAVINEYCNENGPAMVDGDISDHVFNWLMNDLNNSNKAHKFVIGHEPAYPQPDAANGRIRHLGESLDKHPDHRNRFWNLLVTTHVDAYICGHTHNYSLINKDGVWQIDAGHARGAGDPDAPSTYIVLMVQGSNVLLETYRTVNDFEKYSLFQSTTLTQ